MQESPSLAETHDASLSATLLVTSFMCAYRAGSDEGRLLGVRNVTPFRTTIAQLEKHSASSNTNVKVLFAREHLSALKAAINSDQTVAWIHKCK